METSVWQQSEGAGQEKRHATGQQPLGDRYDASFTKQDSWCHLVAVIDCSDRYLVGWRFSRSGKAGISAGALEDALIRENIIPNVHDLVIRSDTVLCSGPSGFMKQ